MGEILTDREAMSLAIEVAKGGAGFVSPNPLVGCVILDRQSRLIATGYHRKVGESHAEIDALKNVKDATLLQGAQVFITLEPCSHHGRTPPCAEALAALPIARVVYGLVDPNPLVAGKGAARLVAAGKKVELFAELRDELEELAEIFLFNMRQKQAFIAVKVATSLDGHIAVKNQGGGRISGLEADLEVQFLRGVYDGIMVGRKTFELDNPRLNVRDPRFGTKQNRVFVVDPRGQGLPLLKESRLYASHPAESITWLVKEKVELSLPIHQWEIPWREKQGFDWLTFSRRALEEGVTSILVEGGAELIASMLRQKCIRRWYQIIAPTVLGPEGLNIGSFLQGELKLEAVRSRKLGRDLFLTGRLP